MEKVWLRQNQAVLLKNQTQFDKRNTLAKGQLQ